MRARDRERKSWKIKKQVGNSFYTNVAPNSYTFILFLSISQGIALEIDLLSSARVDDTWTVTSTRTPRNVRAAFLNFSRSTIRVFDDKRENDWSFVVTLETRFDRRSRFRSRLNVISI